MQNCGLHNGKTNKQAPGAEPQPTLETAAGEKFLKITTSAAINDRHIY